MTKQRKEAIKKKAKGLGKARVAEVGYFGKAARDVVRNIATSDTSKDKKKK